jgi:tetratricopeptide (TPR) repeat protein
MLMTNLGIELSSEETAFLKLNEEEFGYLATFLDFAPESLAIGFVAIDFPRDRDTLFSLLVRDDRCRDIQFEVFHCDDRRLRFLRDLLMVELPKRKPLAGKKLVVVITGLEASIGVVGEYPPVLVDLNYVRDGFTRSVPHPMLICVPDATLTRIAKFAMDFWAWRMAVAEFKALPSTRDAAIAATEERSQRVDLLDRRSKQKQIDELLRLLSCDGDKNLTLEMRQLHILLWNKLGCLYGELSEWEKAEDACDRALAMVDLVGTKIDRSATLSNSAKIYFQQGLTYRALALWNQVLDLIEHIDYRQTAKALYGIAEVKNFEGEADKARQLWQESLGLFQQIGDLSEQSIVLNTLAGFAWLRGDIYQAEELWQKSLEISAKAGDLDSRSDAIRGLAKIAKSQGKIEEEWQLWNESLQLQEYNADAKGKANILHERAMIYATQGKIEDALTLYHESMEIYESIVNAQGKASALYAIASIYKIQGNQAEALLLYRESMAICESIGYARGKAAVLCQMANIYTPQGKIYAALNLYQESMEISESIADLEGKAITSHEIAGIYAMQGKVEEALGWYRKSLEINESMGNAYGIAVTLAMMGKLQASRGDFESAKKSLQESIDLFQQIQSDEVSQVEQILEEVKQICKRTIPIYSVI